MLSQASVWYRGSGKADRLSISVSIYTLMLMFLLHPVFQLFLYKGHFLLVLAGLVVVLAVDGLGGDKKLHVNRLELPAYVFFLLPIVTALWSQYPDKTLWRGSLVLVNVGIFYLAMRASSGSMYRLISSVAKIAPLAFAIAFAMIFHEYGSVRVKAVGSLCNVGAAIVVLCVPYLLAQLALTPRKVILYLCLVASVFVVLLSGSRGGYLALAMTFLFTFLLFPGTLRSRLVKTFSWMLLAFVLGIGVVFAYGASHTISLMSKRLSHSQFFNVSSYERPSRVHGVDRQRFLMFRAAVKAVRAHPVLGIGYGSLKSYDRDHRYGFVQVSHNLLVTAWAEMGIPGMAVLAWLLWSTFGSLIRVRREGDLLFRYMVAATLTALTVAVIHAQFRPLYSNPMFAMLLAQAFIMIENSRSEKTSASHEEI